MIVLSDKQKKFCFEYLKDFNAFKSARRAGYSKSKSFNNPYLLLKNPSVRQFLKSLKGEKVEKMQLTVEAVLNEIRSIAFAIADGKIIKTADKLKALELLGRNLGIFSDKDVAVQNAEINVHVVIVDKVDG